MPRTRKVRPSEQGVDERGHDRALGQHQQAAEQRHHDEDRGEPELLAGAQEAPQLGDELHRYGPPETISTGSPWSPAPGPAARAGSSSWRPRAPGGVASGRTPWPASGPRPG